MMVCDGRRNANKLSSDSHTHGGAHAHTITLKKSEKKERLIQLPKNH